jgi:hypothetical protein
LNEVAELKYDEPRFELGYVLICLAQKQLGEEQCIKRISKIRLESIGLAR